MGRTVLLQHTLTDGSVHLDWLMEQPGAEGLLSFRTGTRIDDAACRVFEAESVPDHRRAYLDYEGPVSGGRGSVVRVAAGTADVVSASREAVVVVVDWGRGARRAEGTPAASVAASSGESRCWAFTITPLEPSVPAR